jgi:hypothetical protein
MSFLAEPDKIKGFFNWLAAPATRNYTLGEVFAHFAQNKPYEMIRDNKLGFTNAGRMVERLHTGLGVISAGLAVAVLPFGLTGLGIAGGFLAAYKVMGLAGGKLADMAVSGKIYNRAPRPPQI